MCLENLANLDEFIKKNYFDIYYINRTSNKSDEKIR